jgi:hypothetical protein
MSDHPRTDAAIAASDGQWSFVLRDLAQELERELAESAQSLAFQTQLNREVIELEKKTLGERNDARKELEQIKAILADPVAVHLNMMRGTIAWTPANLRHLLGDTGDARAELTSLRATLEDPDEVELAMIRGEIAIPDRADFDAIRETPVRYNPLPTDP